MKKITSYFAILFCLVVCQQKVNAQEAVTKPGHTPTEDKKINPTASQEQKVAFPGGPQPTAKQIQIKQAVPAEDLSGKKIETSAAKLNVSTLGKEPDQKISGPVKTKTIQEMDAARAKGPVPTPATTVEIEVKPAIQQQQPAVPVQ